MGIILNYWKFTIEQRYVAMNVDCIVSVILRRCTFTSYNLINQASTSTGFMSGFNHMLHKIKVR